MKERNIFYNNKNPKFDFIIENYFLFFKFKIYNSEYTFLINFK